MNWMFHASYRKVRYLGKENIPTDGAVIFAPNHTNALCDALAILTIDTRPKVFVARADIFKNPRIARLLTGLKIMPIRRMRDGVDEVRHNDKTMDNAVDTLRDGVQFCILPEGTHRPKHSLLPLAKGIFRIALRANEEFGKEKNIYIVPVGIEYGDYYHLWDSLLVNIGKPIDVTRFAKDHANLEYPQLILALREELTLRMREQMLWVPDDEQYETNCRQLLQNPPAPFDSMLVHPLPKYLILTILVLLFPLFLISSIITWPLWLAWTIIRHKVQDAAFHNSIQFVIQFLLIPLSLFIMMPFWMFWQEYMYQFRTLQKGGSPC